MRRGDREAVLRRSDEGWLAGDAPADSALVQRLLAILPSVSASGFPTDEEEAAADFTLADGSFEVFSEGSADVTGRRSCCWRTRSAETGSPASRTERKPSGSPASP